MEVLKFAVLLGAMFAQVNLAGGSTLSSEEDRDVWTVENWQGYPAERGIAIRLADLMKRSKTQQFHGLMGRSTRVLPVRVGRKRNKGEVFVGLMGKRSSSGETAEQWNKSDFY